MTSMRSTGATAKAAALAATGLLMSLTGSITAINSDTTLTSSGVAGCWLQRTTGAGFHTMK